MNEEDLEYLRYLENVAEKGPAPPTEPVPTEMPPAKGLGGHLADSLMGTTLNLGHGLTAGFLDEGLAGAGAAIEVATGSKEDFGDIYERHVTKLRNIQRGYEEQNPGLAASMQIVGGALPVTKAAQAAGAGVRSARDLLRTAGIGGGYAGLEYVGDVDSLGNLDAGAATAQVGLGAALPPVLEGAATGGKALVKSVVSPFLNAKQADHTGELIGELVDDAQMTPAEVVTAGNRLGREASVVDATGATGIGYGQASIGLGGPKAAGIVEDNMEKIRGGRDRIRRQVRESTGKNQFQYYDNLEALKADRKMRADQNYGAALSQETLAPSQKMRDIIERNPAVRDAWERVQAVARSRGERVPDLYTVDDVGRVVGWEKSAAPTARQMQEMKWEIDATVNSSRGATDAAGKNALRRLMQDRAEFKSELYRLNDDLRLADEMYAGDSAIIGALERGKKDGINKLDLETQLQVLKDYSPSERDAYTTGVVSNIYNQLGKGREETLGSLNMLESDNAQKLLTALIGKKNANAMLRQVKTERRYREVDNKLMQGSMTHPRDKATEGMQQRLEPVNDMAKRLADEGPIGVALSNAVDAMTRKTGVMTAEEIQDLAGIITKAGGIDAAIARMQQANVPPGIIARIAQAVTAFSAPAAPAVRGGLMAAPAVAVDPYIPE